MCELYRDHSRLELNILGIGTSKERPWESTFMFDAFPCENESFTHFCLSNSSIVESKSDESEALLRIVAAARLPENNTALRNADVPADYNQIQADGGFRCRERRAELDPILHQS